ncbi:MAG: hypothetical protein MZW92_10035 [Comamonadaceae bacterium]|nr:hypothetical protein [Comamonadaceae bacterium]
MAESAAVGKPDPVNMEVVKAFVALQARLRGRATTSSSTS